MLPFQLADGLARGPQAGIESLRQTVEDHHGDVGYSNLSCSIDAELSGDVLSDSGWTARRRAHFN